MSYEVAIHKGVKANIIGQVETRQIEDRSRQDAGNEERGNDLKPLRHGPD
jgi:hypothetical protein